MMRVKVLGFRLFRATYIIGWQSLRLQTVPGNGACLRHCPSEGQCLRAGALGRLSPKVTLYSRFSSVQFSSIQFTWTLLGINYYFLSSIIQSVLSSATENTFSSVLLGNVFLRPLYSKFSSCCYLPAVSQFSSS